MAVVDLNNTGKPDNFPKGKIILADGRLVDCYPRNVASKSDDNEKPTAAELSARKREQELDEERFVNNAFYFLAHKERILTDSRMFLCPVPIRSGLSLSGNSGFQNPTLGVYLQWWATCPDVMRTDKKGRRSLVYQISGSNLTGANQCKEVREDGKTGYVSLNHISQHWQSFAKVNVPYTEAKAIYQAYSLRQVLEILDHEDSGDMDYAKTIDDAFFTHAIDVLNAKVQDLEHRNAELDEWCRKALNELREEKMLRFYAGYRLLKMQTDFELEMLQKRKRDLKTALHDKELTEASYQHYLLAVNDRVKEIEQELSDFKFKEILKVFPDNDVAFYQIQSFIDTRNENNAEKNHQ